MKRSLVLFFIFCIPFTLFSEETFEFRGTHFIASYSDCDSDALRDYKTLESVMLEAAEKCGATVLGSNSFIFPPDGMTMVIMLSESHASIHTYPEHGACFVDLFTCGTKCSSQKFDEVLQAYLKPQKTHTKMLTRHKEIDDAL